MVEEDALDRSPPDLVTEMAQRVSQPGVAPAWVLARHANEQGGDVLVGCRPTKPAPLRPVVLLRHEPSVPPKDGVGRHDTGDLVEALAPKELALHGQAPSLVVGQAETTASQLVAEDAVLLEQVVDGLLLVAIDQAREQQEDEAESGRDGIGAHGESLCHAREGGTSRTRARRRSENGYCGPILDEGRMRGTRREATRGAVGRVSVQHEVWDPSIWTWAPQTQEPDNDND